MAWPAEVARPADASGGILVVRYNVGPRDHHIRLHIQAFNRGSLHDTDGNPDYDYSDSESFLGISFSTTESSIQDTAVALIAKLKVYYPNTTLFNIAALYQIVDGVAVPVFPAPALGDEVGTQSDFVMADDDPENFIGTHFTMRTRGGGKSSMLLVGAAKRQMQARKFVTSTGGGLAAPTGSDALDQDLTGYLTDSRTRLVGRDGQQLAGPVRVHAEPLARNRRHNFAA